MGEDMVALEPHCTLATENVQLISRISYENDTSEIIIPEIPQESWTFSEPHTPPPMNLDEFKNAQKITELRNILNITDANSHLVFSKHDIHHYTFCYCLLSVIVVYIIIKLYKNKNEIIRAISMPEIVENDELTVS